MSTKGFLRVWNSVSVGRIDNVDYRVGFCIILTERRKFEKCLTPRRRAAAADTFTLSHRDCNSSCPPRSQKLN